MKKRKIFKLLTFFFLFLFVFLLNVRLVKAQDNKEGNCKLQNTVVGHFDKIQYFNDGSTICAFSHTVRIDGSYYYASTNSDDANSDDDSILNVSAVVFDQFDENTGIIIRDRSHTYYYTNIRDLLHTYYQCSNGQWITREISEDNKYCQMPKSFQWVNYCYSNQGGGGDCLNGEAGSIDIEIADMPGQERETESLESKSSEQIPKGAIPCYSDIDEEEAIESADVEDTNDLKKPEGIIDQFFNPDEDSDSGDWGCYDIGVSFVKKTFCISDAINKAKNSAQNFINNLGLKDLKKAVACPEGYTPSNVDDPSCYCIKQNEKTEGISNRLCSKYIGKGEEFSSCEDCFNKDGYWSALGCINFSNQKIFFEMIFSFLIGLAGIIALFCIIYAVFQLQLSQGSPEKIKKAQELITSCIMGLMIIIFSVFILKLVGVDILRIPTFR